MKQTTKKNLFKILLGILISILFVYFLLNFIDLSEILKFLKKISLPLILISFVFYLFTYLLRAIRFRFLIKKRIGLKSLFAVTSIHGMMNNLLPFRIGELSYIYFIKKEGVELSEAVSTLSMSRLGDFIAMIVIFLVIIPLVNIKYGFLFNVILFAVMALVILIATAVLVIFYSKRIVIWFRKRFISNKGISSRILLEMEKIADDFKTFRSSGKSFMLLFHSSLVAFAQYLMFYFLLKGMNLELGFMEVIVAITIYSFLTYLPIQGFAGIGTYEGSWAISLIILGVSRELAISSGFGQHLAITIFFLIPGLWGLLYFRLYSRTKIIIQ